MHNLERIDLNQETYFNAAEQHKKEWFEDNTYDPIFVSLVARDYLAALLFKYKSYTYRMPDLDFLFNELLKYDENISKFSPLNIKLTEGIKDLDFYIPLLNALQNYVRKQLC